MLEDEPRHTREKHDVADHARAVLRADRQALEGARGIDERRAGGLVGLWLVGHGGLLVLRAHRGKRCAIMRRAGPRLPAPAFMPIARASSAAIVCNLSACAQDQRPYAHGAGPLYATAARALLGLADREEMGEWIVSMVPECLDLTRLRRAYAEQGLTPGALVRSLLPRLEASDGDAIWITRATADQLRARAAELERLPETARAALPLYGVPFAVKDNIDAQGFPTTAACPAFVYRPERSATTVQRLLDAGAIMVGKTNLDQFATGLVGVRSPFGTARNPFDAAFLPGGSSSGSAVATAAGLVSFALGTDTAGSGRVPAGFNNIVGLKPTRGLLPATGVVPACRSLDCVSVFALTAADALAVAAVAAGPDADDPYSRALEDRTLPDWSGLRVGVPQPGQRVFCGDATAERLYEEALGRMAELGASIVEIDLSPFAETAALLYEGPWVAERHAAVGAFIAEHPDDVWPTTRAIIETARGLTATQTFEAMYRLEALRRQAAPAWQAMDVLCLPTSPTIYRLDEVQAEPVRLNTNLGTYTNFVNLLDLAALALPAAFRPDGLPSGITLVAPAFTDRALARLGQGWQHRLGLPLGATGVGLDPAEPALTEARGGVDLAVVGAHLTGEPLNGELRALDARLVETARTAGCYRLFALSGTRPAKPGLVRATEGGAAIEVEVWHLSDEAFGRFVAGVPAPLAIGTLELAGGRLVKGFVCEPIAIEDAEEITRFGGWRAWRRAVAQAPAAG